jgi:hypothetical protein
MPARRPLALLLVLLLSASIGLAIAGHARSTGPPRTSYGAARSDTPVLVAFRARAARAAVVRSTRPLRYRADRRGSLTGHPRAPGSTALRTRRSAPGLAAWLARPETQKIKRCESDGDYRLVDYNKIPGRGWVAFYGAWQMDDDFLATYAHVRAADYVSGGRFTLSPSAQDAAAYAGYLARGDEPWACR